MTKITQKLAFVATVFLVSEVWAHPVGDDPVSPQRSGRAGQAQRQGGPGQAGNRPGARQQAGQRPGRQAGQGQPGAPGQRGLPDPAIMAERMLQEFDKNGDQQLGVRELTALFTAMRERGGRGLGRQRPDGKPDMAGQRPNPSNANNGQQRGRRGKPEANGDTGGDKPKRPKA